MDLIIKLKIIQNDTQSVKGEELDEEIESQVKDMELDGWEVSSVNIQRGKKPNLSANSETVERLFDVLFREIENPDSPSRINPKEYTKREIFELWQADLKKFL